MPRRVPDTDPRTEVGQVGAALNRMLGHVEDACPPARPARSGCGASPPTPATSCGPRWPRPRPRRAGAAQPRAGAGRGAARPGPDPTASPSGWATLVDDLLLLARLDAGRPLATEPVDLTRLVLDAVSDAHAAGPGHRWGLRASRGARGARRRQRGLQQVLANLLANARTHTPPGTRVTVGSPKGTDEAGNPGPGRRTGRTGAVAARGLRPFRPRRPRAFEERGRHGPGPGHHPGGGHRARRARRPDQPPGLHRIPGVAPPRRGTVASTAASGVRRPVNDRRSDSSLRAGLSVRPICRTGVKG